MADLNTVFTEIASVLRRKLDTGKSFKPIEFAAAIESIPSSLDDIPKERNIDKLIDGTTTRVNTSAAVIRSNAFTDCENLRIVDSDWTTSIGQYAFQNCPQFNTLILRRDRICALISTNSFAGTPFAPNGSGGTLYVPQSLLSSYQLANNWGTILGYPNNHIVALEGSIYE